MDHTLDRDDREAVALHTANLTPSTDSGEYRFGFGTFETAPSGPLPCAGRPDFWPPSHRAAG